ncbi:hypothetical protein BP6252_10637 [Coleophoma cylindrospora]|uniref:Hemerythrin-like domain-containing protein n=1 Tax=Coleophoma cylindrospora TaxID=1849047 RepID=A0A3D8QT22_9HELO|nr:hypothetical protein BP6252_10637 [Coleophoma cylindrospora]
MTTTTASTSPRADNPLALITTPMFMTKKAPKVAEADKADFVGYCLTWYKFLKTHAENEETSLFLKVEELLDDKTIWQESNQEHADFMPGVEKFGKYLVNLKSPSDFSGTKLLEIMATFQESLEAHMRAEVSTIAQLSQHPRTPKEGSPEETATQTAFDTREGNNLMKSGLTDVLPFFLFNFDREYEDGLWRNWPPIPGPVRWVLMNVAKVLHPGWWKFAGCDGTTLKSALYAAPDSKREL